MGQETGMLRRGVSHRAKGIKKKQIKLQRYVTARSMQLTVADHGQFNINSASSLQSKLIKNPILVTDI